MFAKDTSDKRLAFKINKELLKRNNENDYLHKLWAKDLSRHLTEEGRQRAGKHTKMFHSK